MTTTATLGTIFIICVFTLMIVGGSIESGQRNRRFWTEVRRRRQK